MAFADSYTLSVDANFLHRVQEAIVSGAAAVYSEAQVTSGHGQRAALANAILLNPSGYAVIFVAYVAVDAAVVTAAGSPPVQASVTDAQISNAISGIWNAVAKV